MLLILTIFLKDRVRNTFLIWITSSMLIFEAWAYNFLLLIVSVDLILFDLDKLKGDIGVLETIMDFITKWANIHLQKDLLFSSAISLFYPAL